MAKKVLELFAGSRSIGKAAEALGLQVFSSDLKSFEGIDYAVDVLEFDVKEVPFVPDVIWASPPCTTYSIAAISHHRNGTEPKSDFAKKSDKMLEKIKELIDYYTSLNPSLLYYIENPRGMMRKMPVMRNYAFRHTVTYCQYGDERMKPTDIWTNNIRWTPRAACKNGMSCHTPAPRGSRTGTQGLKNNYERSKIPQQLCLEVLKATL
jgi:site-specific DNA-cytosine methylase